MRPMAVVIVSLSTTLLGFLGICKEPSRESRVAFSVPFELNEKEHRGTCLADAFRPGLNVVLLSKTGKCGAKTAGTFAYSYAETFQATQVVKNKKCSAVSDKSAKQEPSLFGIFDVALVGADLSVVHVVFPSDDKSPVPKGLESRARRIAMSPSDPCTSDPRGLHNWIAPSSPNVFRVGKAALLVFHYTEENLSEDGPAVLAFHDEVFRLCGSCPSSFLFFSVSGKLHLAYWTTLVCCGCGDSHFFVYDLSGEAPKIVYQNWQFSD